MASNSKEPVEKRKKIFKMLILVFEVNMQHIIYCTIFPFLVHYGNQDFVTVVVSQETE